MMTLITLFVLEFAPSLKVKITEVTPEVESRYFKDGECTQ